MTATFLIFLLCGNPVYVLLDTREDIALYAIGSMSAERRAEFMGMVDEVVELGKAKKVEFKVEEEVEGMTCGTST